MAVRLETTNRVVDFAREEVDVVVRAGQGKWPGLVAHKLLDVRFTPMLSPTLAATIGGIREPADILKLPLIDARTPGGSRGSRRTACRSTSSKSQIALSMSMQALDASAAMAGVGVALLTPAYYRQELADGRLIQPFDEVHRRRQRLLARLPRKPPQRPQDQGLPRLDRGRGGQGRRLRGWSG